MANTSTINMGVIKNKLDYAIVDRITPLEEELNAQKEELVTQKDKIKGLAKLVAEFDEAQMEVNNELYKSIDLIEDTCSMLIEASTDLIKENSKQEEEINKWKWMTIVMGTLSIISSIVTILVNFI